MEETNPYQTPTAAVESIDTYTYQPRIFAVSGRIGRLRYLAYGTGLMLLSNILITLLSTVTVSSDALVNGMPILLILIYLFLFATSIVYTKRRLNDLNHTGLLSVLFIVPVGNILLALYLIFARGTHGPNRYGPEPCPNPAGVKILGLLMPILMVSGILAAIAIPAYQDYVQRAKIMQQH
ncbi:DUF805 domain-containing protein [Sedimenticola sp.]|uniref:DUF805 domain-containing protein n=1 Tax=Sedimenticola sp. TaxID=1940285 RepID=UPI003D13EF3F